MKPRHPLKKAADRNELALRFAAVKATWDRDREPEALRAKEDAILAARAKAIAVPTAGKSEAPEITVLEFRLGKETYAIETGFVLEVHAMRDYTPIPCTPDFVLGVLNVRGRILSVVDLGVFFGIPSGGLTDLNKAILLKDGAMEFGILADAIVSIRRLPVSDCKPPLPTLTGVRERYLKGVTGGGICILDAKKLLTDPAMVVRDQVGTDDPRESVRIPHSPGEDNT